MSPSHVKHSWYESPNLTSQFTPLDRLGGRMRRVLFIIGYWCTAFLLVDVLLLIAISNEGKDLEFSLHASIIHLLIVLMGMSFIRLVTIQPGFLPKPSISVDFSGLTKDVHTKSSWIVCKACSIFTSPSAKHCSICNGCLVRSRGHWVITCVGPLNHKFLIQLLFWGSVFFIYSLFTAIQLPTNYNSVLCVGLSLSSFVFLAYHLYLEVLYIRRSEEGIHVTLLHIFGRGSKIFWLFPCSSSVSSKPNIADM